MILSCKNQMQELLGLQWYDEEGKQALQMDRGVEELVLRSKRTRRQKSDSNIASRYSTHTAESPMQLHNTRTFQRLQSIQHQT